MAWNRYEEDRHSRGYGEPENDRSWSGNEESEERRRREMREDREFREGRGYRQSQSARGGSAYTGSGEYGYSGARPQQSGRSPEWRDIDASGENTQVGRRPSSDRPTSGFAPLTWSYTEMWLIPGPFVGQGPRGYHRSDERIKEDVCECLTQHGMIDARNLDVTVENGEVTLRGSVEDRQMKRRAEDAAECVSGVRDVHNEIRVGEQESNTGNQSGRQSKAKSTN